MNVRTRNYVWLLLAILSAGTATAQPYNRQYPFLEANSVWTFGAYSGLDFNTNPPDTIATPDISYEGSASVADSNGQLLFYTGGILIYNRNHSIMPNGLGFYPANQTNNSAQGALIVPVIDTPWKYYVFTNMEQSGYQNGANPPYLAYSVVDMTLQLGLGDVEHTRKSIPVDPANRPFVEGMIAIPGNDCDIWLLTHTNKYLNQPHDSDTRFIAWRITSAGISATPVISPPNGEMLAPGNSQAFGVGCIAVSPDRTKVALASVGSVNGGVLLADFDPATGLVSGGVRIGQPAYGVCFSPDSRKLYVSGNGSGAGGNTNTLINQYEVSTHDSAQIANSVYTVAQGGTRYWNLKLYDNIIYAAGRLSQTTPGIITPVYTGNAVYLDRITNPNGRGHLCNFQQNAIRLKHGTGHISGGLPNEVVFPYRQPGVSTITRDTICFHEQSGYSTRTLAAPEGFACYLWDNGASDETRMVDTPGTYWVTYYQHKCKSYTDTFHIAAVDVSFSLGDDRTVLFCDHPLSYVNLTVDIRDAQITWQDGATGNRYNATAPGRYTAEVLKAGCRSSDTMQIDSLIPALGPDMVVCHDERISVFLELPELPQGAILQWDDGSTGPARHLTDTGTYWFKAVYPPCVFADSIRISTRWCGGDTMPAFCKNMIWVPDAFSPNNDGVNDVFKPVLKPGCDIHSYIFNVYNRYGKRIFSTTDHRTGWDGSHKSQPADMGTYFYDLQFEAVHGRQKYYLKGDVTMIY